MVSAIAHARSVLFACAFAALCGAAPTPSGPVFRESEPNNGAKSVDKLGPAERGPTVLGWHRDHDVDLFEVTLNDPGTTEAWNVRLDISGWVEGPTRLVFLQPWGGVGNAVIFCGSAWVDGNFYLPNLKAVYREPVFTRLIVRVDQGLGAYAIKAEQTK